MSSFLSAAQRLKHHASAVQNLRAQPDQGYKRVKQFQTNRLEQTYCDLLIDATYCAPTRFFLNDLYGDKDFSQRDAELQRVIPALQRFLPESALSTIADAVELDSLSEELDRAVAQHVQHESQCNLNLYRDAYQKVDRQFPNFRERQMALVLNIGNSLNGLVRKPLLGGLIKTMGPVAHAAGLSSMHDFLTRGFTVFKTMGDAQPFLRIIQSRELAIHQALTSKLADEVVAKVLAPN
jgi:hypothetical protein